MKSKGIYLSILAVLSSLIIIPLVSAIDPWAFFDNEWIKFAILFIILFAVMFSFFKPKFNYRSAPTTIVSAGLSILLSIPIMKRGILDRFLSPEIVDWIAIIAFIAGFLFVIFYFKKKFGFKGMIKGILLLLIILMFISIYLRKLIPDSLMYGPIGTIIELIQEFGNWAFFIGGLWVLWFIWGKFKKKKDVSGPTINIHNNNQAQQQRAQQQTQQQNAKQQTRKKIQRDVTFQNRLGRQARIKELRAKKAKKDALKKQNQQKDANQPQPPRNPVG